ncbi:MAG: asparagine--tRNA ligase [Fibrobacteria bacterium]|nr:asparagine--tRNA ligase [Fibrobacteria bacterium]
MRKKIKELLKSSQVNDQVVIEGWVRTRRDSKGGFSFIEMNDGSCMANIQVIADNTLSNYESEIKKLFPGAAIKVSGELKASQGKKQRVELLAKEVLLYGACDPENYVIGKQRVNFELLRDIPHLRPRTNTFGAVFRVRNRLAAAIHRFFQDREFLYIHTPIITGSDCEGAGELFQVTVQDIEKISAGKAKCDYNQDFFKKKSFLTVSGQLELESFACSLGDVYTFGPTFRAENSHTSRHLAEFWMVEPEMAFADLEQDMALAETFLKSICSDVLENCAEDMDFFNLRVQKGLIEKLQNIVDMPFGHMTYTDAITELQNSGQKFDFTPEWGSDLQSEHERFLTESVVKGPLIVTDYPAGIKAFYMKMNPNEKTVRAMDVLVPQIGEIIGGSQREENPEILETRMRAAGLEPEGLSWYMDLRRYGSVPHAGFGLGFERMLQFLTGMGNIRDVIPFPRTPGQLGI